MSATFSIPNAAGQSMLEFARRQGSHGHTLVEVTVHQRRGRKGEGSGILVADVDIYDLVSWLDGAREAEPREKDL